MTDLTKVKEWLKDADAVIVTAGNGMAKEEGLDILSEENFDDEYGKVADKYDVHTIGDALDKKFDTWDEQWAFWSQLVNEYSLEYEPSETMLALKELLKDKQYFIATSTFGHFFERQVLGEILVGHQFQFDVECGVGVNVFPVNVDGHIAVGGVCRNHVLRFQGIVMHAFLGVGANDPYGEGTVYACHLAHRADAQTNNGVLLCHEGKREVGCVREIVFKAQNPPCIKVYEINPVLTVVGLQCVLLAIPAAQGNQC